ncbi:MAG: tRNA-modifying protein YgfZ [Candidatus Dasytiphilus stammeri]
MKFLEHFSLPLSSSELPLTFISMEEWCIITTTGTDALSYMQGQITSDINQLHVNDYCHSAHCNAQGKMLTNLLLFFYKGHLSWIIRNSVRDIQLEALKKYAIFSDFNLTALHRTVIIGIAGHEAKSTLNQIFPVLPSIHCPVVENTSSTLLLYFTLPSDRFLIITNLTRARKLQQQLSKKFIKFNNSKQWLALDIEAGYPIIDQDNSGQFFPQAANLHYMKAISWTKGCYIGQEMIARVQYRGRNKRALYMLVFKSMYLPYSNSVIEIKCSFDSWKKCGKVLAACRVHNGQIWVQAILDYNIPSGSKLRIDECRDLVSMQSFSYKEEINY